MWWLSLGDLEERIIYGEMLEWHRVSMVVRSKCAPLRGEDVKKMKHNNSATYPC